MRIRNRLATAYVSAALAVAALAGCTAAGQSSTSDTAAAVTADQVSSDQTAAAVLAANQALHGKAGDQTWSQADAVKITLNGGTATSSDSGKVKVDGATVTITAAGTYLISGTLDNGQILVTAPDATVKLVLAGANISSTTGAAIAATDADKLIVILADQTQNTLSDVGTYAENADINAALFSKADLTITGNGTLNVKGNGNDAIAGTDGVIVQSGTINVDAVDDGIRGKDYLVIQGGAVTVKAGGDGLKADNAEDATAGFISISGGTVKVTAKGDGADAATDLVTTGGDLTLVTGGGSGVRPADETSAKGLKSGVITVLEGGTVAVDASDDAIHGDGAVRLGGAEVTAASGDDGIHAEGTLRIDSGKVSVSKSVEGLEAAHIILNGGDVNIVSSDDGVNAAGGTGQQTAQGPGMQGGGGGGEAVGDYSVTIAGGTLVINSGGDGFDSNGTATITGGTLVVNGPTQSNNGALDVNGSFQISGGVLLAAGSSGMVVAPGADSAQGWISATLPSTVPAGTTLQVVDSTGAVVATFVTSKAVQNVVYSSSAIKTGAEYKVFAGGAANGTGTGGLAQSGNLGSATALATVTAGTAPAGGRGPGRR